MPEVKRYPLDLNLYEKYGLSQEYKVDVVEIFNIDQNQADDLEYEYMQKGHKVVHQELKRANEGKFDMKIIIAKSEIAY